MRRGRIVRCPKCTAHLLEPSSASVYECPKCSTLLLSKSACTDPVSEDQPATGTRNSVDEGIEKLENQPTYEEAHAGDPPEAGAVTFQGVAEQTVLPFDRSANDTTNILHAERSDDEAQGQESACGDIDEGSISNKVQPLIVSDFKDELDLSADDGDHVSSDIAEFEFCPFPLDRSDGEDVEHDAVDNVNHIPSDIAEAIFPAGFKTSSVVQLLEQSMDNELIMKTELSGEHVSLNIMNDGKETDTADDNLLIKDANKDSRKNQVYSHDGNFQREVDDGMDMDECKSTTDDLSEPQLESFVDKNDCRIVTTKDFNPAMEETHDTASNARILQPKHNWNNSPLENSLHSLESENYSEHEDSKMDQVPHEITESDFRFPVSCPDTLVATCSSPEKSFFNDRLDLDNAEKQELNTHMKETPSDITPVLIGVKLKKVESEDSVEPYSISEQGTLHEYNNILNPVHIPAQCSQQNIHTNGGDLPNVPSFAPDRRKGRNPEDKCRELALSNSGQVTRRSLSPRGDDLVKADKNVNVHVLGISTIGNSTQAHSQDSSVKPFEERRTGRTTDREPIVDTVSEGQILRRTGPGSENNMYAYASDPAHGRALHTIQDSSVKLFEERTGRTTHREPTVDTVSEGQILRRTVPGSENNMYAYASDPADGRALHTIQDRVVHKTPQTTSAEASDVAPDSLLDLERGSSLSNFTQINASRQSAANARMLQANHVPFRASHLTSSPSQDFEFGRSSSPNFYRMNASISGNWNPSWEVTPLHSNQMYRPSIISNDGTQKVEGNIHSHEPLGRDRYHRGSSSRVHHLPNWQTEHDQELPSSASAFQGGQNRTHGDSLLHCSACNCCGHYSVDPHQYSCSNGGHGQLNAVQNHLHQGSAMALMLPLVPQGHITYCGHTYIHPFLMLCSSCPQYEMQCSFCYRHDKPRGGDNYQSYSYQRTTSYAGSSSDIQTRENIPYSRLKSQDSDLVKRGMYPPFPQRRAAPYVICKYCSHILKVPANICEGDGNIQKLICSGCRRVSKFHREKLYSDVEPQQVTSPIDERVKYGYCASTENHSPKVDKAASFHALSFHEGRLETEAQTRTEFHGKTKTDPVQMQSVLDFRKLEPDFIIPDGSSNLYDTCMRNSRIRQPRHHDNVGRESPRLYRSQEQIVVSSRDSSKINLHTTLRDLLNRNESAR